MIAMKNPKCQFEIHSLPSRNIFNEYQWCVDNLNLKDGRGLIYQADVFYIITASEKVLQKVNEHFGSNFQFEKFWEHRVYYI